MSGTSATRAWPGGVRALRRTLLPRAVCAALLAGCDGAGSAAKGASATPEDTTCDGKIHGVAHITVWYHAGPSGEFTTLRSQVKEFNRRQSLEVTIADDGVGGANLGHGSGLIGLVDRVEAIGGRLRVTSPPGEGTTLVVRLPLPRTEG